jgi:SAM-dependent methyltransferase
MSKHTKKQTPEAAPIRLDLGCGRNKIEGWTGVDLYAPGADIKADLFKFPWTFAKTDSVSELHASHFLEHVPQRLRWPFMEECYRILKPEGTMRIMVPNWKSERAYGDMTHEWPPVSSFFFLYLSKGWREANKLTYGPYAIKANFDFTGGVAGCSPDFASKAQEVQQFAWAHYLESFQDMWVALTKKPMTP